MISSFVEGRIRLRAPLLKDPALARQIAEAAVAIPGMLEVTVNPIASSALLRYDPQVLPTQTLMEYGQNLIAMLEEEASKAPAPVLQPRPTPGKRRLAALAALKHSGWKSHAARHALTKGLFLALAGTLATGYVRRRWHAGLGWTFIGLTAAHFFQTRR